MHTINSVLVVALLFQSVAFSQNQPAAKQNQSFLVRYGSAPWNNNSKSVDSAFMFLRDKNSGKVAKISLEETEPDSSVFSGQFSLNWNTDKEIVPELYIPPQNLRNDPRAVERFNALLQSNGIQPQPLMIKKEKSKQTVEVYDTEAQAQQAREALIKEQAATEKSEKAKLVKPQPDESSLQVAKMAAQQAAIAQLAQLAATNELNRIRLEQLEQQKRDQKQKDQARLSALEREKRKKQAAALADEAITYYQKSEFAQAEKLFRQSVELDPDNQQNYFMYGVSLYRTDKLDEALVILKVSAPNAATDLEKKYYMGLIHFRLKELSQAKGYFSEVRLSNRPDLAPSAAFYEGLTLYAEEDLIKSQAAFEYVLDNSSDPSLDKRAEEYIEKIAKLLEYQRMASKKFLFKGSAGLQYDSNILYSPENDSASATTANTSDDEEKGGARWALTGEGEYRFFYKEKSDLSGKIEVSQTQSFSTDFVEADPFTFTATAPYNLKGVLNQKGYKFGITPGYESLFLDYDESGQQKLILGSFMVDFDLMFVMKDDWFSNYTLDVRYDDSKISGEDGTDNDADALKVSIKKTETVFFDTSKKRALIGYLGYTINNADGNEKYYDRIEFGAIYTAPILSYKNTSYNAGLTGYLQTYDKAEDTRKDQNISLLYGITKVLDEKWSWSANASYSDNSSNDADSDYTKYLVMGTINYSWAQ